MEKGEQMNYTMEELVPVVAELTKKAVGYESSSITYEKAEQYMGAVIYCIQESEKDNGTDGKETRVVSGEQFGAAEAYAHGYQCVLDKVKRSMELYHSILEKFEAYGNECLYDTFIKGIPEFFKWYDVRFCPQDTILTLDYPTFEKNQENTGIDAIYTFLKCMEIEQSFLGRLDRRFVKDVLEAYSNDTKNMIENLCVIVWRHIIVQMIVGNASKEGREADNTETSNESDVIRERVKAFFKVRSEKEAEKVFAEFTTQFVEQYYDGDERMLYYLNSMNADIRVRLRLL